MIFEEVPLVFYDPNSGERTVVGKAVVNETGEIQGEIDNPDFARILKDGLENQSQEHKTAVLEEIKEYFKTT